MPDGREDDTVSAKHVTIDPYGAITTDDAKFYVAICDDSIFFYNLQIF